MSIYGALFSGVSGLNAQSNALGIISDNISNVNTVGYKGSKAAFSTLVTQSASETAYAPGGVQPRPLQGIDQQGLLQGSTNATDLAISGNGFFLVNESANPDVGDDFMFTRAGEFRADKEGNLVNTAGLYLRGWPLDDDGNLPAAQQAISSTETVNISNLSGLPRATSELELGANLPSGAANGESVTSTAQVFDALGNPHDLTFTFTKTAAGEWEFTVDSPDAAAITAVADNGAGTNLNDITSATGTAVPLQFDGTGAPDAGVAATVENLIPQITIDWDNAAGNNAENNVIDLNLGAGGEFSGLTNFATDFTGFTELDQNGLQFGHFTGVQVDQDGVVTAVFDNGRRKDIYQLPVAMFNNPNGLEARSGNAFLQTNKSGDFLLSRAGVGGAGAIAPSSLEASTVDLGTEFTNMITTQRAYSASTKVITTSDEMLQELTQAIR
jgi:flagellar hook protein FlgE